MTFTWSCSVTQCWVIAYNRKLVIYALYLFLHISLLLRNAFCSLHNKWRSVKVCVMQWWSSTGFITFFYSHLIINQGRNNMELLMSCFIFANCFLRILFCELQIAFCNLRLAICLLPFKHRILLYAFIERCNH